jgi:hypothetical protein
MFKTVVTLLRGQACEAEERLADRHALSILDQQMRDATRAVERARRALALAMAQDQAEGRKLAAARAEVAELEARAIEALKADRADLAQKAAEAIAAREADAQAAEKARAIFAAEIGRLESHVRDQSARLAELDRGRRLARAAEAVRIARRGRLEPAPCTQATLGGRGDTRAAARKADRSLRRRSGAGRTGPPAPRAKRERDPRRSGFRPAGEAARRRCAGATEGKGRRSGLNPKPKPRN